MGDEKFKDLNEIEENKNISQSITSTTIQCEDTKDNVANRPSDVINCYDYQRKKEKIFCSNTNSKNVSHSNANDQFYKVKIDKRCYICLSRHTSLWHKDPYNRQYLCNTCELSKRRNNFQQNIHSEMYGNILPAEFDNYKCCIFCSNTVLLRNVNNKNIDGLEIVCEDCEEKYANSKYYFCYEFNS